MSVTPLDKTEGRMAPVIDRTSPRLNYSPLPTYPTVDPAVAPQVGVRVKVVARKQTNLLGAFVLKAVMFSGIFGVTYVTRAVAGQVSVEKARHQELDARHRAVDARQAESEIRARVDALTSSASVQQWATARSYIAPDEQNQKPKPPVGPV